MEQIFSMDTAGMNKFQEMTHELIESVNTFSENLPENEIYNLSTRLKTVVSQIPVYFRSGMNGARRADKIRYFIKIRSALVECRDYLKLVEELKYGGTRDLVSKVDNVSKILSTNVEFSN